MKHKKWFNLSELQPACVGAGYVTLDAVLNGKLETPAKLWAGGSCGNVLTIMSYLGWSSYPIARLGYDPAATQVLSDLQSWGVNCSLIRQSDNYQTPIIIQRNIVNKSGILRHYFEFKCPYCGSQLPKFRPVLFNDIPEFTSIVPNTEVFYFDRVRRSSVELAKYYKQQGALIFFEPSSIKSSSLFVECLQIADIVKYSTDRVENIEQLCETPKWKLEIATAGSSGLDFRLLNSDGKLGKWHQLNAYQVHEYKDAAGSGDWCSAGLIYFLGRCGQLSFERTSAVEITQALRFGQALASINCSYEGARGIMYNLCLEDLNELVSEILEGKPINVKGHKPTNEVQKDFKAICPSCVRNEANYVRL